jgi:hypothetical protein
MAMTGETLDGADNRRHGGWQLNCPTLLAFDGTDKNLTDFSGSRFRLGFMRPPGQDPMKVLVIPKALSPGTASNASD